MAQGRVILIHPAAPTKPPEGQPCNGCGVCCLAEPCPVGMLVSLKRRGACKALRWSEDQTRYVCGLMARPGLLRRIVSRWIAAGIGCDSDLEPRSQGQAIGR